MQLSYFLKNSPYLRVLIPNEVKDSNSFNDLLKNGIKEAFIIIPNVSGLVIHLTNLTLNAAISSIHDVLSVGNTESFLKFNSDNLYLEANGVQILDNNGILLFNKDVEKYLCETERSVINEVIHETLLDLAIRIKFKDKLHQCGATQVTTSIDSILNASTSVNHPNCKGCVDRLAGVNSTTRKKRLNRYSPFIAR